MRKVYKSQPPNELTVYAAKNPNDTWTAFRNNNGDDAKAIKQKIFEEQNYFCAYCEADLSEDIVYEHQRRVEHFNSKSGWSFGDAQPNWHLDWNNVIGVCLGGTEDDYTKQFEMPDNKSCDSYKEHLETTQGFGKKWLGKVLSPLEENLSSDVFTYCVASGKLGINTDDANLVAFVHNDFGTSSQLIESTLEKLNLNCDRLNLARRQVHISFEQLLADFRKSKNIHKLKFKLRKWGGIERRMSFQTTRDILIRDNPIAQKALSTEPTTR